MVLPENLNQPEFKNALMEFISFRIDKEKPLSRYALQLVIGDCERAGPDKATEAVNLALKSGWLNLHFDAIERQGFSSAKANGHATKNDIIGTGNQWQPPTEQDVINYALSKKKVSGFGRYCWNLWNGHNWKYFGDPIKNDRQWQSLLLTIKWEGH